MLDELARSRVGSQHVVCGHPNTVYTSLSLVVSEWDRAAVCVVC